MAIRTASINVLYQNYFIAWWFNIVVILCVNKHVLLLNERWRINQLRNLIKVKKIITVQLINLNLYFMNITFYI